MVAVRRPDLVGRVVLVAGVFHSDGWVPGVLEAGADPPNFMVDLYGEVSPDGRGHFPVVAAKLARMHAEEPTLAVSDLGGVASNSPRWRRAQAATEFAMAQSRPPTDEIDLMEAFFHDVPADVVDAAMTAGEPEQSDTSFAQPFPLDRWPRPLVGHGGPGGEGQP